MEEEIEDNIKSKDNDTVETERIMIEIPKNTNFLSIVCLFIDKDGFNANNQILGIKSLKERKQYIEQLESDKQKLIEKLEEELERNNRDTKLAETGKLNLSSEEWREIATEDKLIKEILSILKGEKE